MRLPFRSDPAHPFQLVKFLSWSSLLIILGCSFFLIVVIGNYAKKTVMEKNREYSLLLAENLNHQIYQRFTLPTVLGFGRIQLRHEAQYEKLDQVVQSTIHGFKVLQLRIFDLQGMVSYAMDADILGKSGLAGKAVNEAEKGEINFEVIRKRTSWWSFWPLHLPEKSYVLRTTYPLRTEWRLSSADSEEAIIGVLQFSQDITSDYESIAYFQWMIAVIVLVSSLIIFLMLYIVILRADRNISERIKEKERLERQLLQNEKLASMGRMLASIAHEIRNPLGVIQSSAELLAKKSRGQAEALARLSGAIFEESQRLSRTVNDFLDYARPKQPKMTDLDLHELVEQAVRSVQPEMAARHIELTVDGDQPALVQGDSDLLYRALYNLLTNACQAMDSGGRITVTWDEQSKTLSILDTGPGFEANLRDRYVEPFFTTKDSGTGLGLAIVEGILQNHGAELELANAPGGGGAVRIRFPV